MNDGVGVADIVENDVRFGVGWLSAGGRSGGVFVLVGGCLASGGWGVGGVTMGHVG